MKKILSAMLVCSILATMMLTGCGKEETKDTVKKENESSDVQQYESSNTDDSSTDDGSEPDDKEQTETKIPNIGMDGDVSLDNFEDIVQADITKTTSKMQSEYEALSQDIDTYEKYVNNTYKVEAFYLNLTEAHYDLCVRMCEYSADYATVVMETVSDNDDKYDDLDDIYDIIYDDAGDDIYDAFYEEILDDMYDLYYDGIFDDAYDNDDVPYKELSDARSDEYNFWSDAHSDIYGDWSDCRSDIYDFWSDIRGAVYSDDIERANSKLEKFKEKIEKMKD